jgi:hypothetical protein
MVGVNHPLLFQLFGGPNIRNLEHLAEAANRKSRINLFRAPVGLLDLHTAVSIARRRGRDLSSAGGGEAEERMGFDPPSASPIAIYAGFWEIWVAAWIRFSG